MQTDFKIEVFSQTNCPGCNQVKAVLNARQLVYAEFMIDDPVGVGRQELFNRLPAVRSVPQVFINGKHVGGLEELVKELKSNDRY